MTLHLAPAPPKGMARNRVTAEAAIVAEADAAGHTRLPVLRSQAPLVLRRTPDAVYLVGGAARTSLLIDYAGRPLLRHALEMSGTDSVSLGPAILAGHRAVGMLLQAGPAISTNIEAHSGPDVAVMPLAGPGILVTALAHDAVTLRERLRLTG